MSGRLNLLLADIKKLGQLTLIKPHSILCLGSVDSANSSTHNKGRIGASFALIVKPLRQFPSIETYGYN